MKEPLVISLGGSMVSTSQGINVVYLKKFKEVIETQLNAGRRIFVVVGGGALCRTYNEALKELGITSQEDFDWMGIYATRVNTKLLQVLFATWAAPTLITRKDDLASVQNYQIALSGGWRPGFSSDGAAVEMAQALKATTIVNLTNIDYVYSADPKHDPTAKPLSSLTWTEYLKLIPAERKPGGNYPFDPVASALAQEHHMKVVLMNGENLENFQAYLKGEDWKGTTIGGD